MEEGLALGGIFLGCLMRALLPFLKKKAEAAENNEEFKWDTKYIYTILFSLAFAMVTAVLLFPAFNIPTGGIFPLAFTFGYTSQDLTNKVV